MSMSTMRTIAGELPVSSPFMATPIVFEPATPPRWEYQVLSIDLREREPVTSDELATLGSDGWLLAGILPVSDQPAHPHVAYYFVRAAA